MKIRLIIPVLLILCHSVIHCQDIKKNYFGTWINCKLECKLKLHQPFDSIATITPRFLYFNNLKEIEIETRFEQKSQYKILKIKLNTIITNRSEITFSADTLILKDKYWGVINFIKYKQIPDYSR